MSMHTPGPWFVDGLVGVKASGDRHRGLAICYPQLKDGTAQANARLIAAAPLMLSELERYLPILERMEADPDVWQLATEGTGIATLNGYRNAITAATGATP